MTNPDPIFSEPRLAKIYDDFDPDRSDLDPYLAMITEFHAQNVIDFGCGTGSLALLLNENGVAVTAVDPAEASIDVAKSKRGASGVNWIVGDARSLPVDSADVVVMTGNVAQAIVDPEQWSETLDSIHGALKSGGRLIFETRNVKYEAWNSWTKEQSFTTVITRPFGAVDGFVELRSIDLPLVSFRWTYHFRQDNITMISDSTLRFRSISELQKELADHCFAIESIREAPDRPGKEHVIIARSTTTPSDPYSGH